MPNSLFWTIVLRKRLYLRLSSGALPLLRSALRRSWIAVTIGMHVRMRAATIGGILVAAPRITVTPPMTASAVVMAAPLS